MATEIAKDTQIPYEVVDVVLERFRDVAIEWVINEEKFPMDGLFLISASEVEGAIDPKGNPIDKHRRINVRLSENVRKLYRLQRDLFPDKPKIVNRDTWRGALKWWKDGAYKQRDNFYSRTPDWAESKQSSAPRPAAKGFNNPFLDD